MKTKYTAKSGEVKINGVLVKPGFRPPAKPLKNKYLDLIEEIESYKREQKKEEDKADGQYRDTF